MQWGVAVCIVQGLKDIIDELTHAIFESLQIALKA